MLLNRGLPTTAEVSWRHGSRQDLKYVFVLLLGILRTVQSQDHVPSRIPTLHLPPACNQTIYWKGLYQVNVISQTATNYEPNISCKLLLEIVIPGTIHWGINFTLNEIDLEYNTNNGECSDYIQFWLGGWENMGNPAYQLTQKLCGNSIFNIPRRNFIGKEKQMTMLFHTDSTVQKTGFKAEYIRVNLDALEAMNLGEIESLDPNARNSAKRSKDAKMTLLCYLILMSYIM